jgi:hypothetical protein
MFEKDVEKIISSTRGGKKEKRKKKTGRKKYQMKEKEAS